ncbi:ferredoxin [Salinibacterium sp. ZJ454]|uniref:ferredoxin n=1 Tax=Salinibacterium sp. ZJ454 TaxID=2708339 RepID=UPI00141EF6F8|nr:ferredoxin [Salinibacterium sp. ZJ454]
MDVVIDQGKCIGAGQCAIAASDVFDQRDEDGIVVYVGEPENELVADIHGSHQDAVQNAIDLCPARAIWWGKDVPANITAELPTL